MTVPLLKYASGNSASTTASSSISDSDTALPLTSDTNFDGKSGAGMVVIDEGEATEEFAYATGKSGASLTIPLANRGLEGSAAAGHSAGATVKGIFSAKMWNDLIDSIKNVLDQDTGAVDTTKVVTLTGTQALTNKTLTSPTITSPSLTTFSTLNAPEGFLLNGKIVPSVASNNLTVAIKGMDGNDPSASNPVYVRIGDTVRAITSALSVTKNAGTNWCNAGSSELATKEIDYFVYLGYNATDGVVVGFSRIPYANSYDDFSATTTNEKYAAISTITNAASTDNYRVIGRFAATLSAGAGYTWTVPTFTAKNLIQRPIFETRQLSYVPATTSSSGSYSSVSTVGFYRVRGDMCHIRTVTTVTNVGTAAGTTLVTTPFSRTGTRGTAITAYEATTTGEAVSAAFGTDSNNSIVYRKYTGAFFGANGYNVHCDGWFHLAE